MTGPEGSERRRPYLRRKADRESVAAQLRVEYERSASVSVMDLAKRHDISRSTTQRLLHEAGTRMRTSTDSAPALRPATAADLDALVDSWLDDEP